MGDSGPRPWKTEAFREGVVSKLVEAILQSGMDSSRYSLEMENYFFEKSRSKEEYLEYMARLILDFRGMKQATGANQGAPGVSDPINALQASAIRGTQDRLIATDAPPQVPNSEVNDERWRSPTFRQTVISKIKEAIHQSGMKMTHRNLEMENRIFQKSKNKEEYLGYVAMTILHIRELKNTKKKTGEAPDVPDPLNSLQSLVTHGIGNPSFTTEVLQPVLNCQMGDGEVWRSQVFRQTVISKIQEAVQQSGLNISHKNFEMENHLYKKSKSKEEYLGYVARLILHIRGRKGTEGGTPINILETLAI